jgi:hypothetical protein
VSCKVTIACLNTFIALLPQDLILFRQIHGVSIVTEINDTGTCKCLLVGAFLQGYTYPW